jgi:hypothetical protein
MTKNQIKKHITELERFTEQWVKFRNFLYHDTVTSVLESEFASIRSDITTGQQTLLSVLEFDIDVAQSMMDGVGRITTPRSGDSLTSAARKRLEEEWNSGYLLIQETIGMLEYHLEEKSRLWNPLSIFRKSEIMENDHIPDYVRSSRSGGGVRKIKKSVVIQLLFAVIGLVVILWILYLLGLLGDYLP